jgi:crotonobetainyl-CoA:carnitine CoA-transferase CaiB-like acyl-CoA transferase
MRAVDLTTNIAGPLAARFLAELGADVIHVEPPWGDDGRNTTTAFLGREGTLHSSFNRSKRGIAINVKEPSGQEIIRRLVATADFFVEATIPGTLDALGLGYEDLKAINPRLIQVSVTGWGTRGPLAREPGYAVLAGAYSGSVRPPQAPGEVPELRGGSADPTAGLVAALAALAALQQRNITGQGSLVTTSVFQAAMHLAASPMVVAEDDTSIKGRKDGFGGLGGMAPFLTADQKWIYISAWNDRQFKRLCEIAGLPHIAESPDYATRLQRTQHHVELNELIGYWVSTQQRDELAEQLRVEKIPASPMRMSTDELFDDPQVVGNDMFVPIDHPTKGRLWQLRAMFEIDGDYGHTAPAPMFGQHSDEILRDIGMDAAQIEALRHDGVVA